MRVWIMASAGALVAALALSAGAHAGSGSHAADTLAFISPTGNIRCVMGASARLDDARCATARPRRAAQIIRGQRGREINGRAYASIPRGRVLAYGRTRTLRGILCRSTRSGVACVDRRTKRGFRISASAVTVLPVPPPVAVSRPAPTPAPAPPSSGCDPNYSPCVPRSPVDLDCSDINGPVRVIGTDVHRFDRDGDGIGCE